MITLSEVARGPGQKPWTGTLLLLADPSVLDSIGPLQSCGQATSCTEAGWQTQGGCRPCHWRPRQLWWRSIRKRNRSWRRAASEGVEGASTLLPDLQACRYDLTTFTTSFQVAISSAFTGAAFQAHAVGNILERVPVSWRMLMCLCMQVDREVMMTTGEAAATNDKLPKGFMYVPANTLANSRQQPH